jgi:hypothetical protein
MIETAASKRFEQEEAEQRSCTPGKRTNASNRASPLTWLNLLCLDAPLVAVSWQWVFANSFNIPVTHGATAALFLTAWLIYLADRFGDSLSVDWRGPSSLRQRFCRQHSGLWISGLALVGFVDVVVICIFVNRGVLIRGGPVAALAALYLFLNQRHPSLWRLLPIKEVTIGALFAAGTAIALAPELTTSAAPAWLLFACLCTLNCISIAVWERWLDEAQRRVSISTAFPRVGSYLLPMLLLLALANLVFIIYDPSARALALCVAISATLLSLTHVARRRIQPDVRTALADLVLLAPALVFTIVRIWAA